MYSIIKTIIFGLITIGIKCDEDITDEMSDKIIYYQRTEMIIDHKICDESTINGVLNYDQTFLTKIYECEQIKDIKLSNGSYIKPLCRKQVFPNLNSSQVLYQSVCNRSTQDSYLYCVYALEDAYYLNKSSKGSASEQYSINYYKEQLVLEEKYVSCIQKVFNTSVNMSDAENVLGKYAFKRFSLRANIWETNYLMSSSYARNESFSSKTEPKKLEDYLKCFELLSKDCVKKFNGSLIGEYKESYGNDFSDYNNFVFEKLGYIYYLVRFCQTEKYGNTKVKEYFDKNGQELQSVFDCQLKALGLSENEKKINIPTEQDLRQQFNTDYI